MYRPTLVVHRLRELLARLAHGDEKGWERAGTFPLLPAPYYDRLGFRRVARGRKTRVRCPRCGTWATLLVLGKDRRWWCYKIVACTLEGRVTPNAGAGCLSINKRPSRLERLAAEAVFAWAIGLRYGCAQKRRGRLLRAIDQHARRARSLDDLILLTAAGQAASLRHPSPVPRGRFPGYKPNEYKAHWTAVRDALPDALIDTLLHPEAYRLAVALPWATA